ncbi:cobaltochelatase subunit CobN [Notoacmeibacter sp. MSK16QG-6]|uniref:cobaltochelatase subunit CobN n=1 Tax=Notoacmeibacter sp. MSK16QG-6 TaxID=2957982 RepID=UPI0020A232CA|nr:cobaltochelatase subunit CobN [Notoacmeibacter sp. MSK16QG-6]MCP1199786.1 cobaltochelatase subunit CobN [Notoacmeibacter sp. MSK16QG-6]
MHIPSISTASLDGSIEPLDLGQDAAEMVLLSFSDSDLRGIAAAHRRAGEALPDGLGLRLASLRDLRHPMSVDLWIDAVAAKATVIVVRILGGYEAWPYGCDRLAETARQNDIALALLPGECSERDDKLAALSTLSANQLENLLAFFRQGGPDNMDRLRRAMAAFADTKNGVASFAEAEPLPRMGFWLPQIGTAATAGKVLAEFESAAPCVPILFYRSLLLADDANPVTDLAKALADNGVAPLPVFVPSLKDEEVARFLEELVANTQPALLITTTGFAASFDSRIAEDVGDRSTPLFERLNVPVVQAAIATTRREAWAGGDRGFGATDMAMHCVLPELDGRIMGEAIAFKALNEPDPSVQMALQQNTSEPSRIAALTERARRLIALQKKPRAERRIVLILPDYPGAEGREGYAVGLDVFTSTIAILNDLAEAGYTVGDIPAEPRDLLGQLRDVHFAQNAGDWKEAFGGLPEQARRAVIGAWGEPDGTDLHLRHTQFGNITVCFAPDRGRASERRADYHDPALPPTHDLLAFGHWMRETIAADAILHLGAHGTLEWLPGKAVALSKTCFPEIVTGQVPVVYPFIVSNPGEAAQAKRRIGAVTLGHLPPPLKTAGLTDDQAELERLVDEFVQADGMDPRRRERLRDLVLEKAEITGFDRVAAIGSDDDPDERLLSIDAWLCDLKEMAVKDGQHIYGRAEVDASDARQNAAATEQARLIDALDGRFVPPGPSGSPDRGRLDVLPTGRNLTVIDPRTMPTPTAFEMGRVAAEEVLRFHLQKHGDWPRSLVMDLWASASLRTGGEELAHGLWLMGCRPVWDHASGRITAIDVLPIALLGRPRVDVTFRISGLFRDMFAAQIELLHEAIRAVAERDEDETENPLRASATADQTPTRVFGTAPGTYGAGVEDMLQKSDWDEREAVGEAYLAATAFSFDAAGDASPASDAFRQRVASADLLIHTGDDKGRDLLEGNADAAHIGGFAAAAAALGKAVDLICLDTTDPDRPKARDVAHAVARIVRARATHRDYIDGQMRHGPRGASDFAETVDRLIAFAETTEAIDPDLIEAVCDAYLHDQTVRDFLLRENPAAARAIVRRLNDAIRRRLWQPRRNSTQALLAELLAQTNDMLDKSDIREAAE